MLALWIPMTDGTLDNKGLSDVYVKSKGTATVSNDGDMGKCYYLDGTSYMTLSSNMMEFIKDRPFSYGCWFKTSGLADGMTACGILSFTYGCSLFIYGNGKLNGYLDNGTNLDSILCPSTNLFDAKWHHLFYTYDGFNCKIYVDGTVVGNKDIVFKSRYNNTGVIGTDTNNHSKNIGKGYICDVRVYDECLPLKMVKLLAQGLYLHYPMNQIDRERNLLEKTNQGTTNWGYNFANGEKSIESIAIEGDVNAVKLICTKASTSWQYTSYKISKEILNILKPNTDYTVSFDMKGDYSTSGYISLLRGNATLYWSSRAPHSYNGNESWKKIVAVIHTNDLPDYGTDLPVLYITAFNKIGYVIIKNLKLEIANNPDPVWTPAWEDEDSWLDTTEYDTSGYCNNGSTSTPPP